MGCSGSTVGCAAEAQARKQRPWISASFLEGDFKVQLEKSSDHDTLGVAALCPGNQFMVVQSVREEGMIPAWNRGCHENTTPELLVKPGDIIVAVNGILANSDGMKREILRQKSVIASIKRALPQEDDPIAEASIMPAHRIRYQELKVWDVFEFEPLADEPCIDNDFGQLNTPEPLELTPDNMLSIGITMPACRSASRSTTSVSSTSRATTKPGVLKEATTQSQDTESTAASSASEPEPAAYPARKSSIGSASSDFSI